MYSLGQQWSEDTILKVMIIGKPEGHLTFLTCPEFKQEMSPANMNVATFKLAQTLVKKITCARRLFCWEKEKGILLKISSFV